VRRALVSVVAIVTAAGCASSVASPADARRRSGVFPSEVDVVGRAESIRALVLVLHATGADIIDRTTGVPRRAVRLL
jgi:hypothetical protein